jgi:hypothetical protein
MNFLALAQRLRQECRVSGSGPTDVSGQVAEYQRLLDWTAEAWREIQRSNEFWRFMRRSATCPTVNATATYAASSFNDTLTSASIATTWGRWALDYDNGDTFRSYDTTAGITSETPLLPIDYDTWRDTYQFGATRTTYSRPAVVALAPDGSLAVGPVSAAGYTLIGDYYVKPVLLTENTDTPAMPEEFHMAIVYLAMTYYGVSEAASEIGDLGQMKYEKLYRQLVLAQAPRYRKAGALV